MINQLIKKDLVLASLASLVGISNPQEAMDEIEGILNTFDTGATAEKLKRRSVYTYLVARTEAKCYNKPNIMDSDRRATIANFICDTTPILAFNKAEKFILLEYARRLIHKPDHVNIIRRLVGLHEKADILILHTRFVQMMTASILPRISATVKDTNWMSKHLSSNQITKDDVLAYDTIISMKLFIEMVVTGRHGYGRTKSDWRKHEQC